MLEAVNDLLGISPDDKLAGSVITLAESSADGTFLLHHFISFFLSSNVDRPVCFLSFCQSFNHYKNVCQKLGTNLLQQADSDKFRFFDGMRAFGDFVMENENPDLSSIDSYPAFTSLKPLYHRFQDMYTEIQTKHSKPPVVVIDNVNILLNIGYTCKEINLFLHYLCELISAPDIERRGTLIQYLNTGSQTMDDDAQNLWKSCLHMSTMDVLVSGLDSGYCKDVHGKIDVHWRDKLLKPKPSRSMQFKLSDKSVTFFAAGMSKAVL